MCPYLQKRFNTGQHWVDRLETLNRTRPQSRVKGQQQEVKHLGLSQEHIYFQLSRRMGDLSVKNNFRLKCLELSRSQPYSLLRFKDTLSVSHIQLTINAFWSDGQIAAASICENLIALPKVPSTLNIALVESCSLKSKHVYIGFGVLPCNSATLH